MFNKTNHIKIIFTALLLSAVSFPVHAQDLTSTDIINSVNYERSTHNLNTLEVNEVLTTVAQDKAQAIIKAQVLAHNLPGRPFYTFADDRKYEYKVLGENLAIDYDNAKSITDAWMNSPLHRKNVLDERYTQTGVAVLPVTLGGMQTILTVQIFAEPSTKIIPLWSNTINHKDIQVNLNTATAGVGSTLVGLSLIMSLAMYEYSHKKRMISNK